MAQYLLVRDRDGTILGELQSAVSAARMLHALPDVPLRGLSLVRLEDSPGAIVGTNSIISMRSAGLGQPIARRSPTKEGGRKSSRALER